MTAICLPMRSRTIDDVRTALVRFVSEPASALPLAVLRIGLALLLLWQAIALAPYLGDLFGSQGLVQSGIADRLTPGYVPRLSWFTNPLAHLGMSESSALRVVFAVHVCGIVGMLLGWQTRICVGVAWLTNLAFMTSGYTSVYGAGEFLNIALFYCLFFPVHGALAMDHLGAARPVSAAACRLGLRILQFHLMIVYVTSGIEKGSGTQWWNGEAIWRAMTRTDLGQFEVAWLANVAWLPMVVGWATIILEAAYGLGAWLPKLGRIWVISIILMHVGIAVAIGLSFFACVMILLNVSAWLVPSALHRSADCRQDPPPGRVSEAPAKEIVFRRVATARW